MKKEKQEYSGQHKKTLGQFYTTNVDYILEGLSISSHCTLIEPFVGQGDIKDWVHTKFNKSMEVYDIDPKIDAIIQDTLLTPPEYKDKFVITNPPYLFRGKSKDKTIYDKYKTDDLYKAFIKTIIAGKVLGGIIIIPLNFLSSDDSKIRDEFFSKYQIKRLNIFEETVFNDTSYTVCAFEFYRGGQETEFEAFIYPKREKMNFSIDKHFGWRIGGELPIFNNKSNKYKIGRLREGDIPTTNLFLYAIDTGTKQGRIRLEIDSNHFFGKISDRSFATIKSSSEIKNEALVVERFNEKFEQMRSQYNSLFLTNYRDATKNYARKRISFRFAYNLIEHILLEIDYQQKGKYGKYKKFWP